MLILACILKVRFFPSFFLLFMKETDIGLYVNGLRKHPLGRSQEAGEVAHQVENMDKNVAKHKFFSVRNMLPNYPLFCGTWCCLQFERKWKEVMDGWVRLHNSVGDGGSSIAGMSLCRVLQTLLDQDFRRKRFLLYCSWLS